MEQNQNKNNEVLAAITLALHEYQGYTMHVSESGVLTLGKRGYGVEFQVTHATPTA